MRADPPFDCDRNRPRTRCLPAQTNWRAPARATRAASIRLARFSRCQRTLRTVLFAGAVALLGGCSDGAPRFKASDITGMPIGGEFALPDQSGQVRRLSEFKGKVVVAFFGYTQCPDVCPTTLSEVATAMKELGAAARDVQVLFLTVDPERDTPQLLSEYVQAFDRSFLALRGSQAELEAVARQFKVFFQKNPTPGGGYTMDHTAASFVFDRQGRIRLLVAYGAGAAVFAHDLAQLLR